MSDRPQHWRVIAYDGTTHDVNPITGLPWTMRQALAEVSAGRELGIDIRAEMYRQPVLL
jgi:hypothetical protein